MKRIAILFCILLPNLSLAYEPPSLWTISVDVHSCIMGITQRVKTNIGAEKGATVVSLAFSRPHINKRGYHDNLLKENEERLLLSLFIFPPSKFNDENRIKVNYYHIKTKSNIYIPTPHPYWGEPEYYLAGDSAKEILDSILNGERVEIEYIFDTNET